MSDPEVKIELARRHLYDFVLATKPGYHQEHYLDVYASLLTLFARGEIKKLIITMPPQHGKTELSTRRLPAFMFGQNPNMRAAIASYSQTQARKFGRETKRIMNAPQYKYLFPETRVATVRDRGYTNTQDQFDIVDHEGSLIMAGRGAALTGNPLDTLITDDIFKDMMEANSPVVRASVIDWYFAVADSRLHNDSQQLMVFTRWASGDLIGWLEEHDTVVDLREKGVLDKPEDSVWYKLNLPAIKEGAPTIFDPRNPGEPLWPWRHSLERLEKRREQDLDKFNALYQGNPKPVKGLLFPKGLNEWTKLPPHYEIRSYTDTADQGDDYLCTIVYTAGNDGFLYVLDVYYTNEAAEITEPDTVSVLMHNKVEESDIESNSGGRSFARNVQRILEERDGDTDVRWFHQSQNKEARILTNAATIRNRVLMPPNWRSKYPEFAQHLLEFRKLFKANEHDDAPDCLTGCVERSGILESESIALGVG